ncbi:helix-turn-helix transcriptional regulator [Streptomyces durmitorensis]|uniref:Helix-turn-helix transcriptional regulator n=1 Tax=Streptomyces durmitorensis TaxID=319947 RepID=A0ABY4PUM8_9ACTN|nr:helix-turn-helix transcriptional regulator [Streptomyces durmitorensis]UQT56658.1 helix-turn-helix transcriptional regulator [Streptomyces durmitorensis]
MTTAEETARRGELGTFLRAYRERLAPDEVGLPATPRRRTPGLRREEVAALSGVGVAWYTWLEQGRVDTSRQVLDAVSRTLRLDGDAHRHVLALAGFAPQQATDSEDAGTGTGADDNLRAMIGSWSASPALVLAPDLTITAWNTAYSSLFPDPGDHPAERRNLLLLLIGDPAHQRLLPAWEPLAQDLHRHFRARADTLPRDARVQALTERLHATRPDLAHWWACRAVGGFAPRTIEVVDGDGGNGGSRTYDAALLTTAGQQGGGCVLVLTPGRSQGA